MNEIAQETSALSGRVRIPIQVRVSASLIAVFGIGFALIAVAGVGVLMARLFVPVAGAVFGLTVAVGLLRAQAIARVAAFAVVALFVILHVLISLADGPWWMRMFSVLAAAGYLCAGALLTTRPVREFMTGVTG